MLYGIWVRSSCLRIRLQRFQLVLNCTLNITQLPAINFVTISENLSNLFIFYGDYDMITDTASVLLNAH